MNDPRRFGSVEIDPAVDRLGPDATTITTTELAAALASARAVKAVLLDQTRIAGLGNLLVDETLWRAGIDPARIARTLDLSPHTVKRHVANILDKLGAESRGQAAAWRHAH